MHERLDYQLALGVDASNGWLGRGMGSDGVVVSEVAGKGGIQAPN